MLFFQTLGPNSMAFRDLFLSRILFGPTHGTPSQKTCQRTLQVIEGILSSPRDGGYTHSQSALLLPLLISCKLRLPSYPCKCELYYSQEGSMDLN